MGHSNHVNSVALAWGGGRHRGVLKHTLVALKGLKQVVNKRTGNHSAGEAVMINQCVSLQEHVSAAGGTHQPVTQQAEGLTVTPTPPPVTNSANQKLLISVMV